MNDHSEKRWFTRVSWNHPVTLTVGDQSVQAECRDLSMHGALLRVPQPPEPGSACRFSLPLDEAGAALIEADCRVVRCADGECAVEFTGVELDSMGHLRNLVAYNADDAHQIDQEIPNLRTSHRNEP
ncbi:MAG TPA: PilZ domain-containing protein [Gammaproteobacteria bacterium]|nr:PilZ domain-containing protein [Gammaproteobacteria bacterium]